MFISLMKVSVDDRSIKTKIILNSESLFYITQEKLQNKSIEGYFDVTRVELLGYNFHTMTSISTMMNIIPWVDVTSNWQAGSECAGNTGHMDIILPTISWPLIKVNAVRNKNSAESFPYFFNPAHLIYSEEIKYIDSMNQQQVATMISLRDQNNSRQILSKINFLDFIKTLAPVHIE